MEQEQWSGAIVERVVVVAGSGVPVEFLRAARLLLRRSCETLRLLTVSACTDKAEGVRHYT